MSYELVDTATGDRNPESIIRRLLRQKDQHIAALEADLDCERMRLAACGTAALGYYKRGETIAPEYTSGSLNDVLALRDREKSLRDDLRVVGKALFGLYQHTKNNYGICGLNTAAKDALSRSGVVALMEPPCDSR